MYQSSSRLTIPFLFAAVFTATVASGTAFAASACAPVACDTCAFSGIARTSLPGYYSNDYDYSVSSQVDTGVGYLVPTQNGLIESNTMPLLNDVDRYYATHTLGNNGQIIDTSGRYQQQLAHQQIQYLSDTELRNSVPVGTIQPIAYTY